MKTKSPPNRPAKSQVKMPKAFTAYVDYHQNEMGFIPNAAVFRGAQTYSVLILPQSSPAQAKRALKNFWGLSEEGREQVMAKLILDTSELNFGHKGARAITWETLNPEEVLYYLSLARALHSLITGGQKP